MQRKYPIWLYPHLLSLDAPLVAAVWQEMFSQVLHVQLAWRHRWILFLMTWTIYAADRVFDSLAAPAGKEASRHIFARQHRGYFLGGCALSTVLITWIAFLLLRLPLRNLGIGGAFVVLIYLSAVHGGKFLTSSATFPEAREGLKKEMAVAVVFTSGTALAPWAFAKDTPFSFFICFGLFAFAAFVNCGLISKWESPDPVFRKNTSLLSSFAFWAATISLLMPFFLPSTYFLFSVFIGLGLSALAFLDYNPFSLNNDLRRVLADVALLGPLPVFLWKVLT